MRVGTQPTYFYIGIDSGDQVTGKTRRSMEALPGHRRIGRFRHESSSRVANVSALLYHLDPYYYYCSQVAYYSRYYFDPCNPAAGTGHWAGGRQFGAATTGRRRAFCWQLSDADCAETCRSRSGGPHSRGTPALPVRSSPRAGTCAPALAQAVAMLPTATQEAEEGLRRL